MSAVPRQPGSGYAGLRLTAEEFLALGETSERYELVDGVVCMSPKPSPRHQRALRLLQRQFEAFIDSNPGFDYYPDVDIRFDSRHVYAPDICCFRPGRVSSLDATIDVPPDLIVEILSPGSKAIDLTRKRADYGRFGVGEYWVLDPQSGGVRCFRSDGEQLVEVSVGSDASLSSVAIEGFVLDLAPFKALARVRTED